MAAAELALEVVGQVQRRLAVVEQPWAGEEERTCPEEGRRVGPALRLDVAGVRRKDPEEEAGSVRLPMTINAKRAIGGREAEKASRRTTDGYRRGARPARRTRRPTHPA